MYCASSISVCDSDIDTDGKSDFIQAALNIEHLQEVVKPYKQGWKDLQLPKGHKRMLRSLVKTHLSDKQLQAKKAREGHEYDIVKGKGKHRSLPLWTQILTKHAGQGLIVLLHGAPGVGKTSTAGKSCILSKVTRVGGLPMTCRDCCRIREQAVTVNNLR